jgi:hypothetical protein
MLPLPAESTIGFQPVIVFRKTALAEQAGRLCYICTGLLSCVHPGQAEF